MSEEYYEHEGYKLPGTGLTPGDWDIIVNSIMSSDKDKIIRVSLNRNTSWKELLKIVPKGTIVKKCRKLR